MKKIYIFVITCILLFMLYGCGNNEYKGINSGAVSDSGLNIYGENNFEITDEVAIDIGNAIIKSVYGEEAINKTEYNLRYFEKYGVYLFARIPTKLKGSFGWDYEVAIRKEDGTILGVWRGE